MTGSQGGVPTPRKTPREALRRKVKLSSVLGQVDLDGNILETLNLEDKIPDNVHTLFVGINPGIRSATIGHYYGGHSNYFWKLLHASGIWPVPITTFQDDDIVKKGFGLTDMVKRPTPGIAALRKSDFTESRDRLKGKVRIHSPRTVVFVSKRAVRAYLGENVPIVYGRQKWKIDESVVFVVPSTSGASQADTLYEEKLAEFKKLARHISTYYKVRPKAR